MIYLGNWNDPDGVPFDANAFSLKTYSPSGVARMKRRARRSTHHQDVITKIVWQVGKTWLTKLTAAQRADWATLATSKQWTTRDGELHTLTPFTFWQRCQIPPWYGPGVIKLHPPIEDPMPPTWVYGSRWQRPGHQWQIAWAFGSTATGLPHSGISIFQVHPTFADGLHEHQYTRIMYALSPWPPTGAIFPTEGTFPWPIPPGRNLRILARWYSSATVRQLFHTVPEQPW